MQKRILTTLFLVGLTVLMLTLTLTHFAAAEWKDNKFTNNTSGNLYVAFNTLRPAKAPIPEGWRTVGWYKILPGGSHTFQAWADNPIYYLIWDDPTQDYLTPDNAKTFAHWEDLEAFVTVSRNEPNVPVTAAALLYSNRPKASLISSDFFKSGNGGSVTVTPARRVVAPLAEITAEDADGDTVARTDPEPEDTEPETGGGVVINITPDPSSTTLNQGQTRTLTISVTENGDPLSNRDVFLSVSNDKATVNPTNGKTNDEGQFSTTLKVNTSSSEGAFTVTANLIGTTHSKTLSFEVEVAAGQIRIAASASSIEPGQTSTLTITSLTPGGTPFPGAQIALGGGNINPNIVTTGANGRATATFRADSYSTPSPRLISRPTITATLVDNPSVTASATPIRVEYILGSFSVSGVPRTITSGSSRTITVTVKSRRNTPLSGVRVTIVEGNDDEIAFSSLGGNTNNSGKWSTTMRTGNKGQAEFSVKVSGLPTQVLPDGTNSLTVKPEIRGWIWTDYKFTEGCWRGIFGNSEWKNRSESFTAPGPVVDYTIRNISSADARIEWNRISVSGRVVRVPFWIYYDECENGKSWIEFDLKVDYEVTASTPSGYGAPSLHLQEYEQDLSLVAAHPKMQLPSENALLPNYPNPFNPETWIPYHLSEPAEVTLSIYSAEGKLVRTLALGHQPAGIYENKSRAAYWDGRNAVGERVASGLYFYTLTAGDFADTGKMLIMK